MGGCCSLLVLVMLFLNWFFASVEPNHVGIKFNTLTKQVDLGNVYPPGRHLTHPFVKFIAFPMTVQNVAMTLTTRTSEGYPLTLKTEFQYKLLPEKVLQLYSHYTTNYKPVFQRNVRAAMMKSMSDYDAPALFKNRKFILQDMERRVQQVLMESYAKCWSLQFDDVTQPPAFEKTLLLTQLQEWYSKQKLAEQRISAIQAKTQVLQAEFNKNISVVNSTATARCQYIHSEAIATSSNFQNEAHANATLLTDKAKAQGGVMVRQAQAEGELEYQRALALGETAVLRERAEAKMRQTHLEGLRLQYWQEQMGLSEAGLVQFQKLLGSYDRLENITFLFGFDNAYASAEASPVSKTSALAELTAIAGAFGNQARKENAEL